MIRMLAFGFFVSAWAAAAPSSWSDLHAPSSVYAISLGRAGSALLAGTWEGNLFRSPDGGAHWSRAALPTGYPVLSILSHGQDVYAARSSTYNPLADCFSFCQNPTYPPDLAVSHDGGLTWSTQEIHGAQAMARTRDGSLWAFARDSLYRLAPTDPVWRAQPYRYGALPVGYPTGYVNCKAAMGRGALLTAILNHHLFMAATVPSGDALLFTLAADSEAYALAGDSEETLAALKDGLYRMIQVNVKAAKINDKRFRCLWRGDSGWLAVESGKREVLRSLNTGKGWLAIDGATLPDTGFAIASAGGAIAAIAGPHGAAYAWSQGGAWKSGEGLGETLVLPKLAGRAGLFVQTSSGVLRADRGASTWSAPVPSFPGAASHLVEAGGTLWTGGGALWQLPAGASAWKRSRDDNVSDLAASGSRLVAALRRSVGSEAPRHLVAICDAGDVCRETPPDLMGRSRWGMNDWYGDLSGLVVKGDTLLVSDNLLYRSLDGGARWDTAQDLGPSGSIPRMVFLGSALFAIRSGYDDCYPCLMRSDDLGSHWSRPLGTPSVPFYPAGLESLGGRLYAITYLGAFASPDGAHWQDLALPSGATPVSMTGDENELLVGDGQGRLWSLALPAPTVGLAASGPGESRTGVRGVTSRVGYGRFADGTGAWRLVDGRAAPK